HLEPFGGIAEPDAMSERRAACSPDAFRQTPADDRDRFTLPGIMFGEVPPLEQRRADGPKISRSDRLVIGFREPCRILSTGLKFELITTLPTDGALQWPDQHRRGRNHAGCLAEPVQQARIEGKPVES